LLKKQQQLEESTDVVSTTQEPLSNIAIAIDPTYSSRRTELQDNFCKCVGIFFLYGKNIYELNL